VFFATRMSRQKTIELYFAPAGAKLCEALPRMSRQKTILFFSPQWRRKAVLC